MGNGYLGIEWSRDGDVKWPWKVKRSWPQYI